MNASSAIAANKTVKGNSGKASRLIYNGGGSLGNKGSKTGGGGGGNKKDKKTLESDKERYYEIE